MEPGEPASSSAAPCRFCVDLHVLQHLPPRWRCGGCFERERHVPVFMLGKWMLPFPINTYIYICIFIYYVYIYISLSLMNINILYIYIYTYIILHLSYMTHIIKRYFPNVACCFFGVLLQRPLVKHGTRPHCKLSKWFIYTPLTENFKHKSDKMNPDPKDPRTRWGPYQL